MRLSELQKAGRTPSLPLSIELADAAGPAQLQLLSLLRVLPGQRYVGAGVWRGRTVLAKLMVGSKAARNFQRELTGVRLLAEQGLTTPQLLADGLQDGEGGWLNRPPNRVYGTWLTPPGWCDTTLWRADMLKQALGINDVLRR